MGKTKSMVSGGWTWGRQRLWCLAGGIGKTKIIVSDINVDLLKKSGKDPDINRMAFS